MRKSCQPGTLLVVFAGLALFIAAVGLYGVLSYRVTNRTREIGVRVALGATSTRVARMVLAQGIALTGAGCSSGYSPQPLSGALLRHSFTA